MSEEPLKCKIVSFRVADEEYLRIKELAQSSGFGSVSFFAREATLKGTPIPSANASVNVPLERLNGRLETLTLAIEKAIAELRVMLT